MLCPSRLLWQRALQDRVSQNNTRTARPRPRPQLARPRPRQDLFLWSQTGLILRPTVSDHITVGFIPGQGLSKQAWVSSVSPTHGSPPCSGPIHWRWRLCVPFPHVTLHAPQADQLPNRTIAPCSVIGRSRSHVCSHVIIYDQLPNLPSTAHVSSYWVL